MVARAKYSKFDQQVMSIVQNRMMWNDPILMTQMQRLVENSTLISRQALISGQGQDPRRSIDDECGYPSDITPQDYRNLFDREPIANRVVKVMPKECFQMHPEVYEDEDVNTITPFEQAWHDLAKNLRGESYYQDEEGNPVWEMILRLDIVSRIATFGLMLMGIDDGRRLDQPIDGFEDSVSAGGSFYPAYGTDAQYGAIPLTPRKNTPTTQNIEGETEEEKPIVRNFRILAYESVNSDHVINFDVEATTRREALDKFYRDNPQCSPFQLLIYNAAPPPFDEDSPDAERPDFLKKKSSMKDPIGDPQTELNQPRSMDLPNQSRALYPIPPRRIDEQPGGRIPNDGEGRDDERFVGGDDRFINDDPQDSEFVGEAPTDEERSEEFDYGRPGGERNFNDPDDPENYDEDGNLRDPSYPTSPTSGEPGITEDIKPVATRHKLNFLRCYDETLIWVIQYESDPTSIRYGFPVYYNIILNDPRTLHGGIGLTQTIAKVHWSRVIHAADNLLNSEVFGQPAMMPVYNRLLDIKKLHGGSAEMYWKGAFPGFMLTSHPNLGGDVTFDVDDIKNQMEQYFNSLQRYIAIAGAQMQPLAPQVVDPTQQIQTQIDAICVQLEIPKRVFMGSERGELASSQDDQTWNDRIRQRRNTYLTPRIIVPFIDRLIKIGVLPRPKGFSVIWPDLNMMNDLEKSQYASGMASALATYVSGDLEQVCDIQDFYVRFMKMDEEEAMAMVERVAGRLEQQQQMDQELHAAQLEQMTNPDLVPDQRTIQQGDTHQYPEGYGAEQDMAQADQMRDQYAEQKAQAEMSRPDQQLQGKPPSRIGATAQQQEMPNPDEQFPPGVGGSGQETPPEAAEQAQPMDGLQPIAKQLKSKKKGKSKPSQTPFSHNQRNGKNIIEEIVRNYDNVPAFQIVGNALCESGLLTSDYGEIFVRNNEAWFVGGENDAPEIESLVKQALAEVRGITNVRYSEDRYPPRNDGWMQVFPRVEDH